MCIDCVYKMHHLACKRSRVDMQTQNIHENNSRMLTNPDLCILLAFFHPVYDVHQKRARGSTQNRFMISREKHTQKAFTTPQKTPSLFLFFSSSVSPFLFLPIICSTKARHSFWMISAAKEMWRVGRRGWGKKLRQQWQVFRARHNFITTSWAMKNMTSSPFDVTAVDGES